MTETEKRYSQTEKDALAIKWAKERLRIYLHVLGATGFRIVTAHKPLIPLFDKLKAKVPSRIEKWIMEMQDVRLRLDYVQPSLRLRAFNSVTDLLTACSERVLRVFESVFCVVLL